MIDPDLRPLSHLLKSNTLSYPSVFIDLWRDGSRLLDIVGTESCPHGRVKKDHCLTCGAFVGHFGHEKDPLDYLKNVHLLVNTFLESKDVYLISHRPYFPDYKVHPFARSTNYKGFRYVRDHIVYDTVDPSPNGAKGVDFVFVYHFSDDLDSINEVKSKFIYRKDLDVSAIFNRSMDTLWVNPRKSMLNKYTKRFTYLTPNSDILVLLKSRALSLSLSR